VRQSPRAVYRGERLSGPRGQVLGVRVTVDIRPLDPRPSQKIWNHSPCGFEWGYGGSGPAQLSLALVLDATGDPDLALESYQWFKWGVVACWGDRWTITAGEIFDWLERYKRERKSASAEVVAAVEVLEDLVEPHSVPAGPSATRMERSSREGGAP
jgi:Family of unknown function (DUF6166)